MSKSPKSAARDQELTPEQYDALIARCRANMKAGKQPLDGLEAEEVEALQGRYSTFDDAFDKEGFLTASEVVLKKMLTPRPFVHLLSTNHFGLYDQWASFWDQHGGGFSCVDSVLAGRMTSHLDTNYVPTSPELQDVRNFYIHEKGRSWPMFPVAGHEDGKYSKWSCREGMDHFELEAVREALSARLLVYVHRDLPLEVWQVTLTNRRKAPRDLSWFLRIRVNVDSFPFYYFVPRVVCEGVIEDGAMVFLNHDKGNKHPRTAFMMSSPAMDGFDMMNEIFEGGPGRAPIPAAVARGQCFNSLGLQPYAGLIAAQQFNAHLEGLQSSTWTIIYGRAPNEKDARKSFLQKVRDDVLANPEKCFAELEGTWRERVTGSAIKTPDVQIDRYYNVWSKYQLRNQSRYISALDKVGYRDIMQYMLGTTDFEPQFVKAAFTHSLRYQFPNGLAPRQYEKFAGSGHDMRLYHDMPLWIPDTLVRYVEETGDRAFLDEQVAFLDEKTLQPSATDKASVYEHACRAIRFVSGQTGYHGLCRIGYGDWNDSISGIGGEKGVSVWLSMACVYALKIMAELATWLGKDGDQKEFLDKAAALTAVINEHAWDGQWYIYAINGQGEPIGSSRSAEGKLHLNVNTWSIFSGVAAAAGREEQVWKAIEQLASPFGHILLKPSYTLASRKGVGRIADIMPGMFENGSVYTHGEAFYLFALLSAGKADDWHREVYKTLPSHAVPDISSGPPHQQSNFSVGPDHVAWGTNLFSNFTGSVGWLRRTIEKVVGVVPEFDGLRIAPQPPSAWPAYQVKRNFRGCSIFLDFKRGKEFSVLVDGKPVVGGFIPADRLPAGQSVLVEVTYK
ncbi:MAG: GH36-type glycosyl hydrolase domain-containing protein [Phycisphaerae bacterium]